MLSAQAAIARLREGNRRFVADRLQHCRMASDHIRRDELVAGQEPFAILLGCADSRVPAEIVFDQGLGDLFDIRVAGNIVAPSQIGSVEFAVERVGTRLVVVLGHSRCGAVAAAIEDRSHPMPLSPHLRAIVDRIRPSVDAVLASGSPLDADLLMEQVVRRNIHAAVQDLTEGSPLLAQRVRDHEIIIVGAEYSVETGLVEFFAGNSKQR
jgi:carbonic anhydrase